jgi:hypothetical protein
MHPAEQLPLAVGFGSGFEFRPSTLWVVPRLPADVVPLPLVLEPDAPPAPVVPPSIGSGSTRPVPRDAAATGHPLDGNSPATSRRSVSMVEPAPLRLTARGRAVLLVLAALIGTAVVVMAWFGAGSTQLPAHGAVPARVVVHQGDTLWSIAGRVAPGRDPRAIVDQLSRVNHLSSPDLIPGQILRTH